MRRETVEHCAQTDGEARSATARSRADARSSRAATAAAKFGVPAADDTAAQLMRDSFPGREIVPVSIDAIASSGGGVHDQPALK